ncbi:MAG: hypothetical protein HY895_05120 [Deltaproteobacteria bacterium]|nr:hypothetical protein [Deltaproteobacteria bacterium]
MRGSIVQLRLEGKSIVNYLAVILSLLVVFLTGCAHEKPREAANFELKNFRFDVEEKEYNVTYRGKGLLLAQSPAMQDGSYFVFLKARDKHTSQVASELVAVILTKGEGELAFTIFYGKSQGPVAPPEFTWEVVGYVPLLPATIFSN